jgi:hypothetical protein
MNFVMARNLAACVLSLWAAGCSPEDPIDRLGTWRPTGANDWDLRAMIANPGDLVRGEAAASDRGDAGAKAVTRLLLERRRPLIRESSSSLASLQQQSPDQPLPGLGGAAGAAQPAQDAAAVAPSPAAPGPAPQ